MKYFFVLICNPWAEKGVSAVHFHLGERGFLNKNDSKNFLSYKPKGELSEQ